MLGFETVGNATLVVHDAEPVLVTDPWVQGSAYFGSWGLAYEIPPAQREAIAMARAVWFSHGHPDHLNPESLPLFRDRRILLPDHLGGRIAGDLRRAGYRIEVVPDGRWVPLTDRVRVLCITDPGQDAVLLVDLDGVLAVNLNDAQDLGWGGLVKRAIRAFDRSFLLRLSGWGDADMMNFVDADGAREASIPELRRASGMLVGAEIARMAEAFGVTHFAPFSSFHRYQRADSAWANEWTTKLDDYRAGFASETVTLLPPFVRYDCATDSWEPIDPAPMPEVIHDPSEFDDDWRTTLDADDRSAIERYFHAFDHLARAVDAITFRVGDNEHTVAFDGRRTGRAVTFAAPRTSLMRAITGEVFDDLLIGNFMTTTLHGSWPRSGLYPDFTPYVTKYGDNGRAHTDAELRAYFAEYRGRLGLAAWLRTALDQKAKNGVRARLVPGSRGYETAKRVYARTLKLAARR